MFLGIDIGASYCKVVVINSEKSVVFSRRTKMPPFIQSVLGIPHTNEVDISQIVETVLDLLKTISELTDNANKIEGIGLSSQMHGIVLTDQFNVPLSQFLSWQDQRAAETMLESGQSYLNFLQEKLVGQRSATGTDLRGGMMGPLLFWLHKNECLQQRPCKVSFLSDYIAALLTDTEVVCDPTHAAGSGIYDLTQSDWSELFFEVTGVPEEIMPMVVKSGLKIGEVTDAIARKVGIRQGTPVFVSIGDHQSALLGAGLTPQCLSLNVGTGAQVSMLTQDTVLYNSEVRPFFNGYQVACISGLPGGRAIALFEKFIQRILTLFSDDNFSPKLNILNRLDEQCLINLQHAGTSAITCDFRFFNGEENKSQTGFSGITKQNFTADNLYLSLIQSLVDAYSEAFQRIKTNFDLQPQQVVLSGGVSRKSQLLQTLIRQTFEMEVRVSEYEEEAAVGAALLARQSL